MDDDALLLSLAEGLGDRLGVALILALGDGEKDGDREADGLILADGEGESEGESDGLTLADGLADADGDRLPDNEALGDNDDLPTPSGVWSTSRKRHATCTT